MSQPSPEWTDDDVPVEKKNVLEILDTDQVHESPIDLNISKTIPVHKASQLVWTNYDLLPKKMKITNTGHTVIVSGKWGQERPYVTNGVLMGKYVFSQIHFHWGVNDMEGSEHTIDGSQCPGELHVVHFKSCYLTQESALKERDGIIILVYMLKLQDPPNPNFQPIVDALSAIAKAHTSAKIPPVPLNHLLTEFPSDYFMYRGSVTTTDCTHFSLWLITRVPIAVSPEQIDSLRYLLDNDDEIIKRNFRPVQPINDRKVFHILPSSSKYSTLLPYPSQVIGGRSVTQIYQIQVLYENQQDYVRKEMIDREKKKRRKKMMRCPSDLLVYSYESYDDVTRRTLSVISELSKYMDCL